MILYDKYVRCEERYFLMYISLSYEVRQADFMPRHMQDAISFRSRNVKLRIATISVLFGIIYVLLYLYKIRCCQVIVISPYMVMISQICGIFNNKIQKKEELTYEEK